MKVTPTSREEMHRRAAKSSAARRAASPIPARGRVRNLAPVFALDQNTFFVFRGRAYGVPPLPWETGERLLDMYIRANEAAREMARGAQEGRSDRGAMSEYFAAVSEMPDILWAHCFPASRLWRMVRRVGLMRNPFRSAGERDLMELADFFLSRRMKSGVQFPPTRSPLSRDRATSSTS